MNTKGTRRGPKPWPYQPPKNLYELIAAATIQGQCWIWPQSKDSYGYGIYHQAKPTRKLFKAHRAVWELLNGPIPKGMQIMHSCDTRACIRPDHLSPGTPLQNMQDMWRKGRGKAGSNRKITAEQVNEIRAGKYTNKQAAKLFGVHPMTVSAIRNGRKRSRSPHFAAHAPALPILPAVADPAWFALA